MTKTKKKVILIGAGGHALSFLELHKDLSIFEGYVDFAPNPDMPIKYLGNDEFVLSNYAPDDILIHNAIVYGSEVNLNLRTRILEKYSQYEGYTKIADSALITRNTSIGSGCGVFEKVVVNRSFIGNNCILNTGAIIEHNCHIGNNVFIGPGAIVSGGVSIADKVFVGCGSIIRDDISICSNVLIGMGCVVTKDITKPGLYMGLPAIKKENDEE